MTSAAPRRPRRWHDEDAERGSLTVFMAIVAPAVFLGSAGIVVDGIGKLNTARAAYAYAEEAARAGADSINAAAVRAGHPAVIDPAAAIAAAHAYLSAVGVHGTVAIVPPTGNAGPTAITVTVTVRRATEILSVLHIDSWTVTGTATADLEQGA